MKKLIRPQIIFQIFCLFQKFIVVSNRPIMEKSYSLFRVYIRMSVISWNCPETNPSCKWLSLIVSLYLSKSTVNYANITVYILNLFFILDCCLHFKEAVIFWKHEYFFFVPIKYLIQLLLLFLIIFRIWFFKQDFVKFLNVVWILFFQIWKVIWILSFNFLQFLFIFLFKLSAACVFEIL